MSGCMRLRSATSAKNTGDDKLQKLTTLVTNQRNYVFTRAFEESQAVELWNFMVRSSLLHCLFFVRYTSITNVFELPDELLVCLVMQFTGFGPDGHLRIVYVFD